MKILIAEDDTATRLIHQAMLEKLRHEVVAVADGREAWQALRTNRFSVAILDWLMPEMDGLTICRTLRKSNPTHYTVVVIVSVLDGKTNFLAAMDAGADDFITKPIDADQLAARLRVVERLLGLRTLVKQLEGMLPICAYCKKIRDDQNHWKQIETYIAARSDARFTHSICPECKTQLLSELE